MPSELASAVPDAATFAHMVLGASPEQWQPAYGCVGGALPLGDLVTGDSQSQVLYLYGEVST